MMTLKDWRFFRELMEHTAKEAYALGRKDEKASRKRPDGYFKATGSAELAIKKLYSDFIEKS